MPRDNYQQFALGNNRGGFSSGQNSSRVRSRGLRRMNDLIQIPFDQSNLWSLSSATYNDLTSH
jgi:hypothetical protein